MEKQPSWQGRGDSKAYNDDDVIDNDNDDDKDVNKDKSTTTMNLMTGQHKG